MAVFRINKTEDYTIMSNNHFKEKDMSLKAKGLLSLMLSLPPNWDYSVNGLVKLSKDGKDSVVNALKELEQFKYLKRTMIKDDKGQFSGYDYDIYEFPYTENPYAEKPNTGNQPQLNTNKSNTKELNTKDIYKKEPKKAYGSYGRIKLSDKEYNNLVNDYGQTLIDNQINLLDEYVESNNNKNKYTNFNLVLRKSIRENWFNKGVTNGTNKGNQLTGYEQFEQR